VNVYVFNDDNLADAPSSVLAQHVDDAADSSSKVFVKHISGGIGDVLNVITRDSSSREAAFGKYVRVEKLTGSVPSALSLAEVEVYAADSYQAPPDYPEDVKYVSPTQMKVELWDPVKRQNVWKTVPGELLDLPATLPWFDVQKGCGGHQNWDYARSTSTTKTTTSSSAFTLGGAIEREASVEVSGAVGILTNEMHGWWSHGWESASSSTLGNDFTLGGWRSNYCPSPDLWPDLDPTDSDYEKNLKAAQNLAYMPPACAYGYVPFYFRSDELSDGGRPRSYIHVSYIVQMDRGKDLRNCYDNHWRRAANQPPAAPDIEVGTQPGQDATIDVVSRASDPNPEDTREYLRIAGVASTADQQWKSSATTPGGSVAIANGKLEYTPAADFTGDDTFLVMLTDGDLLSNPIKVTVRVYGAIQDGSCDTPAVWAMSGHASVSGGICQVVVDGSGAGGSLSQSFSMPATGADELDVSYGRLGPSTPPGDKLDVILTPAGGSPVTLAEYKNDDAVDTSTGEYDVSAYAGQVVTLTFKASGPADSVATSWWMDAITLR
jgi:hypothetical protein